MKHVPTLILGIIIGVLAMYLYSNAIDRDMLGETPIVAPKGLISPQQAKVLDQAYDLKHRIINDSLFKQSKEGGDNRSSWWSIDDVENYIAYAKNQAKDSGYVLNGLRLYLGSHPNRNGKTGLTTVFFIPTGDENVSKGSFFTLQKGGKDLGCCDGLNAGNQGDPPNSNYPQ